MKPYDLFGWFGVVAILLAYGLNMFDVLTVHHYAYLALNAFGAVGLILSSYQNRDYQPVLLNSLWLIIALVGITLSVL